MSLNSARAITHPGISIDDFKYILLSKTLATNSAVSTARDQAYAYFEGYWKRLLAGNGVADEVPVADSFQNADMISLIMYKDDFAGLLIHSLFDLRTSAGREHEYFNGAFGSTLLEHLDVRGIHHAMSMEWLTVDPRFRKSETGFSLAMVLIALAARTQQSRGIPASLQRAREDVGVDRMLQKIGGTAVRCNVPVHNTPVSVMITYTDTLREDFDPLTQNVLDHCWANRIDSRERDVADSNPLPPIDVFNKKAA